VRRKEESRGEVDEQDVRKNKMGEILKVEMRSMSGVVTV
jgi:hypothetical protein